MGWKPSQCGRVGGSHKFPFFRSGGFFEHLLEIAPIYSIWTFELVIRLLVVRQIIFWVYQSLGVSLLLRGLPLLEAAVVQQELVHGEEEALVLLGVPDSMVLIGKELQRKTRTPLQSARFGLLCLRV